ncbi:MAG: glycosyltransferase family 4 protein [Leptospiraceae bacterium]|nr:glycosyltransferase family 4 protein [Leptospiraceae bacterium]MCP5495652.1 glycosyltransferase family 4 protein [Leptospiraceae bacterium]
MKTKKIGIDARMIGHSGIGTRIYHILKLLPLYISLKNIVLYGETEALTEFQKDYEIISYNVPIYSLKELLGHSTMKYIDILDIPHFNVPLRFLTKCMVTIHDIIPYKMREYHNSIQKRIYLKVILNSIKLLSKKIIVVSEYTKRDLVESFDYKHNVPEVIYNAVDHALFKPQNEKDKEEFRNKYHLPEKYLLAVGIGKEHKNLRFIVNNLSTLWANKDCNYPLVIAGSNGIVPESIQDIFLHFKNYIIPFPKIAYNELPLLYACANMLIFPSLYEGFGFPVLEAQSVGCPVLSSNATVLPEVLRETAHYFHPQDNNGFVSIFTKLISDKSLLDKYKEVGFQNSKMFQWDSSVRRIAEIYESI